MNHTKAYSAASATSLLTSTTIPRRDPTERDVQIEILFCGICHSDLHQVRNQWSSIMPTVYPIVPGHEIVGRVTKVGAAVTKHKPGDLVGVGCLVDSDHTCPQCKATLPAGSKFCPNCGYQLTGGAKPPAETAEGAGSGENSAEGAPAGAAPPTGSADTGADKPAESENT